MKNKAQCDTFAFCEPSTATGPGPWHIRVLPAGEERRVGGGVDRPTLCGRDLRRGWDLELLVTLDALARLSGRDERGRPGVCPACADHAGESLRAGQ